MTTVLSLCVGMGLLDRAFMDEGFEVVAGCEIDPDQRGLYRQLCGGEPLCHDIRDLSALVAGEPYAGVIGGPPCQSHSRLRAIRVPKFADLTEAVKEVLAAVAPQFYLFENVLPLRIWGSKKALLNAMHFGQPHQSRARWFTHSRGIGRPAPVYLGTVDDLMAYPVVAGRIYGPKRGAILQGYPPAAGLKAPCAALQKGLANGVHYALGRAWAAQCRKAMEGSLGPDPLPSPSSEPTALPFR